jgi:hypothetical protein
VNRALTAQASAALAEKAQRLRGALVTLSKDAQSKQKQASALEPLAPWVAQGAEEVRCWLAETAAQGIGPDERRRAADEIVAIARERGSQGGERHARARSSQSGTMSQRPASVVPPSGPAENVLCPLFRGTVLQRLGSVAPSIGHAESCTLSPFANTCFAAAYGAGVRIALAWKMSFGIAFQREESSMSSVSKRVAERLVGAIKRYQPILAAARSRDVNEADTVTIVKDMLADVFGYDKYSEVTSEFAIRGNFCDLAIKVENKVVTLIEVKAIGLDLKDQHVKQAVDYAANQGVEWVLLTNGVSWRVYHIVFGKPIDQELIVDIDFLSLNHRSDADLSTLHLWCKEGWSKSVLGEFRDQKQALSKFSVGAVLLADPVLDVVRRELRRLSPDAKIDSDQIRAVLSNEVIKRDVLEGEKADEARKRLSRAASRALRERAAKDSASASTAQPLASDG